MYKPRKRRLHEKIEVNIAPNELGPFTAFYSLNISVSGALLASYNSASFSEGQLIQVCIDPFLRFLSKSLILRAKIVRTADSAYEAHKQYIAEQGIAAIYGIEFCDFLTDDIVILEEFIERQFVKAG